jgi:hypothetical protein
VLLNSLADDGGLFPWTEWGTVRDVVSKAWDPLNDPHHLLVGATGSGKSYLAVNGILKNMCPFDRVLIVDTKGDDPTVSGVGKAVRELPRNTWYSGLSRKKTPMQNWYRLVTYDGAVQNAKAREQVGQTLLRCIREGNWVIFLDEAAEICDPGKPNLGLGTIVAHGLKKGRSKRVSFLNATQSPVWIPRWLVDQASFTWIGRIRDEERHKRLVQIGGLTKADLPFVASLEKRDWLLTADPLDLFMRTRVVEGG